MSLEYRDRVKETTTTTGTGSYALAGAMTGFQAFSAIGNGNTCFYAVTDGTNWEVGLGTYSSSGPTLARTSVLASSNSGSAVNWGAGTKQIWLDLSATPIATHVGVVRQQVFTSSGTYTPHANMVFCIIECVGGGGGGGGTTTAGPNQAIGGGGGAGGEYSRVVASKADIGASKAVTIGSGGGGGSAGANNGGGGGTTSLGSLCTAIGGGGGGGNDGSTVFGSRGNPGGGGTGGMCPGGYGANGVTTGSAGQVYANTGWMVSGVGGGSVWGAGAPAPNSRSNGIGGNGYGAGGGGGIDWNGSAARSGGAGSDGKVIITEYCSV